MTEYIMDLDRSHYSDAEWSVVTDGLREVVGCRDCKYFGHSSTCWLPAFAESNYHVVRVDADGWCAWGERAPW